MSLIFPNKKTPILCQGITSEAGEIYTEKAIAYGSNVVAGVSKDSSITHFLNVPVYQTVKEAVQKTHPQATMIFSSPARVCADVEEAMKARIPLVVCMQNHIPYQSVLKMQAMAEKYKVCLIGPSSQGVATIGQSVMGAISAHLFPKGTVGIISRSNSLTYEVVQQLDQQGLGVSTCVSVGSSAVVGSSFIQIIQAFLSDPKTKAILIIGRASGSFEMELASFLKKRRTKKPIIVYLTGRISRRLTQTPVLGSSQMPAELLMVEKKAQFKKSNIIVAETVEEIAVKMLKAMQPKNK